MSNSLVSILATDLRKIDPAEIQSTILEKLGIKTEVRQVDGNIHIACQHVNSCFEVMRRLRWDFDYSVHKIGKLYILEV